MIGLALAGGGVKGSYEVGAYDALKKCHIKIDGVSGTSIGAFNGAMIAANKNKELKKFWDNIDVGKILGLDEEYVQEINNQNNNLKLIGLNLKQAIKVLKNHGLDIDGLKEVLDTFDIEKWLRKSNIDFGLCTYKLNTHEPVELFKKEIPGNKINEYILASCYLPIFKPQRIIGDSFYFDGGIYDNCPANMLLKKGYSLVYRIELNSIGKRQRLIDKNKVITIKPSRKLSPIITINNKQIIENYWIGYYDTLKVVKNYPGYQYLFKKRGSGFYKFINRKVPIKLLNDMKKSFNAKNEEELILKVLEHIMIHNNYSYFKIYDTYKLIKRFRKTENILVKDYLKYLKIL